ncbi:unnamed protein product [Porites lobata]|uniref:Phospholipase B-like n=1 Tax=Porites lobata TaxID=104759 RepID=A0ABN8Q5M7_9CNID|nr:unnamed protein product [Porites lobata]
MASWREPLRFLILIVSLAVCLNIIAVKGEGKLACVVQNTDDKTLQVKLGCDSSEPRAVAWGKFRDEIHSTGWSFLEVHSNGSYPDMTQAVAVGMTEGFLTGELIYKAYQNTLAGYCDSEPEFCMKLGRFLAENEKWMMAQITSNPGDKYWYQVKLILAQSEGLKKGYAANASLPSILDFAFLLMQAALDIPALEQVLGKKNIHHMIGSGHCSALIKLLPGNKDLFISHVTWDSYSGMLRVFKTTFFQFRLERAMADGRVYASSEAVSVEQREFSSEQDIPDPATYVSSLKTDELKAELIKRGLKRSGNKSVLIDRLRAAIQSQDQGEEPIERSSSNADMDERLTARSCSNNKLIFEDFILLLKLKSKNSAALKLRILNPTRVRLMQMSWSYHCRMRSKIFKTNCRSWSPITPF